MKGAVAMRMAAGSAAIAYFEGRWLSIGHFFFDIGDIRGQDVIHGFSVSNH
jgi:hypothetical protein